jgi:hypothetical protein
MPNVAPEREVQTDRKSELSGAERCVDINPGSDDDVPPSRRAAHHRRQRHYFSCVGGCAGIIFFQTEHSLAESDRSDLIQIQ